MLTSRLVTAVGAAKPIARSSPTPRQRLRTMLVSDGGSGAKARVVLGSEDGGRLLISVPPARASMTLAGRSAITFNRSLPSFPPEKIRRNKSLYKSTNKGWCRQQVLSPCILKDLNKDLKDLWCYGLSEP